MLAGRLTKLFPLSVKYSNEEKQPIPLSPIPSSWDILCSLSCFRENSGLTTFPKLRHPKSFKARTEEGISLMAVPLKSSSFKHFIFQRLSGRLARREHSERMSISSDLKLIMLLGRHSRFLQPSRFSEVRAVKHSIDEGNFLIFEQPERLRIIRDFILVVMLGR